MSERMYENELRAKLHRVALAELNNDLKFFFGEEQIRVKHIHTNDDSIIVKVIDYDQQAFVFRISLDVQAL